MNTLKNFSSSAYEKSKIDKAYTAGQNTANADGGHTVPSPLADYYIELLHDSTVLRQLFSQIFMTSKTFELPQLDSGLTGYILGEGADWTSESGASGSASGITKAGFSKHTMTNYKLGVFAGYTSELQEDSLIDIAEMLVQQGVIAMAKAEEQAWINGDADQTAGQIGAGYTAGQPEYYYSGLIAEVPYASNSGTAPVGAGWTAKNQDFDAIIDNAQALLREKDLNKLMAITEANVEGDTRMSDILVSPYVLARMRDPIEFENFQRVDAIGADKAALLRGNVGDYYGTNIISSGFIPVGTDTAPQDMDGTNGIVSNSTDTVVLGLNRDAAMIGMRREVELMQKHNFEGDYEELRWLERVAFHVTRPEFLAMIGDVKNAID